MTDISQLTKKALSLPLDDRIRLAQELWASLQTQSHTSAAGDETENLDVADRRDAELETGSVEGVAHADALAKARKSLECE